MVTLVVEDGTGITAANSYISLADADAYFADRNNLTWPAFDDASRTQFLFNAAISLDGLYQTRYLSQRIRDSLQGLQFPRYVFWDNYYRRYDQGDIPPPLLDAQCEIAFLDMQGINIFPEERADIYVTGGKSKVGELEVQTTYQKPPSPDNVATYDGFRKIEILLQPILQSKRSPIKFTR